MGVRSAILGNDLKWEYLGYKAFMRDFLIENYDYVKKWRLSCSKESQISVDRHALRASPDVSWGTQTLNVLLSIFLFFNLYFPKNQSELLTPNWLQEVKELVKLNACRNIWLFLCNIQGEIVFQILQNLWVAKVLMSL